MHRNWPQYYRFWTMLGLTAGELLSGTMAASIPRSVQNSHLYTLDTLPICLILLDSIYDFRF